MKTTNIIVTWLMSGGFLLILGIVSKHLNAFLVAKKNHNKAAEEREVLGALRDLADIAVTSQVGIDAPGHEKFAKATKIVNTALDSKGIEVEDATVQHAVQAAYEKSGLTPTVDPSEAPTTGVVVHD